MSKITRVLTTAAAATTLVLGAATTASANGNVTWENVAQKSCIANSGNNDAKMKACGDWDAQWYDQQESDGSYTQHVRGNASLCLAAYSNHDVYVEPCTANNSWQRFYEHWDQGRGIWRLQHVQTGWYITVYDNGYRIGVDPYNEVDTKQWFR
ncbi:hypothetical protein [Streptomyces sp. NPDC049949]|uniref:hypothetical protein n=1 Tax=Streptomyces sp. NPDC049949 TaxID=3154627 RepID=UPI0034396388